MDRRKFERRDCFIAGRVRHPRSPAPIEGFLENISRSGCLFRPRIRQTLPQGSDMAIETALFPLDAQLVTVSDLGYHCAFVERLDALDLDRLFHTERGAGAGARSGFI